jgi:hypothetical protein
MRIDFFFLKSKKKGFCKENPSCTNLPKWKIPSYAKGTWRGKKT